MRVLEVAEVLTGGLSNAAGTGTCAEAREVWVRGATGQPLTLADDLPQCRSRMALMDNLSIKLDEASRMAKVLGVLTAAR